MSKLNFVEDPLSDGYVDDSDDDIGNSRVVRKENNNNPVFESVANLTGDELNSDNTNGVALSGEGKKKKRKKKKAKKIVDTATVSNIEQQSMVTTTTVKSGYLSAFLSKKRTLDIFPPPEIELSHDTYLKQFSEQFKSSHPEQFETDEISDAESNCDDDVYATTDVISSNMCEQIDLPGIVPTMPEEECEDLAKNTKLSFYNLPYSITADEIVRFAQRLGYSLENVVLGFDKRKNLPSGSATVEISSDVDANACIAALQSENCGGRPIRVQRCNENKRRMSGTNKEGSRYFVTDMSFKCQSCGEVGHKQFECTNPSIPTPCHLCAGRDHEAMNCPNITCYRCGLFGHHSRDCRNPPMSRPVVCTQCGSSTHDARNCREVEGSSRSGSTSSRVDGRWIRCVSCNQFGHTMCQALPKLSQQKKGSVADVYCPNCGEQGHHIDYLSLGTSFCCAPKFEAYMKYPKLLADIDAMPQDVDSYYRDLIRYNFYNDQALFPSLMNTANGSGNGTNSGRVFNMLPSYISNATDNAGSGNNGRPSNNSSHNSYANGGRNSGSSDGNTNSGSNNWNSSNDRHNSGRTVTPSRPPSPPRRQHATSSSHNSSSSSTSSNRKRGRDHLSDDDDYYSDEEDDRKQRNKKNYCDSRNTSHNNHRGSYSTGNNSSSGNSRWSYPLPVESGRDQDRNRNRADGVNRSSSGNNNYNYNSKGRSDFEEKVEARRKRFGDIK